MVRKDDSGITKELRDSHGISEDEYERIIKIMGRQPNITELGVFSVMWSEHCSYKSSRVHLKRFPTTGEAVIYGPGENAGVIDIGDGYAAVFKMESHNHPSFIEPYQGAATGVGGILRDVFTMGARPIALMDSLRFGDIRKPKNKYLLTGVVAGIAGYGNCMGVPTVGGEIYFDPIYDQNNLVNAFCLGIVKKDRIFTGTAAGAGNPVLYVGSKTGRDGIHGATMASAEFDDASEEKRPTVQVGDPFSEKLLLEACLELMSKDLIVGIQDMGAAGLTSSSCEMASRGGSGVEIDLSKVPVREEGMTPYEIMLSESQERMLLVAKQGAEQEVVEIFHKWDIDAEVIGKVTNDGMLRLFFEGELVAGIPAKQLADEAPLYERPVKYPEYQQSLLTLNEPVLDQSDDLGDVLIRLLGSPTLAGKEFVYGQYDYMVRTNTVIAPGEAGAAVVKVKGTNKGLSLVVGCNSAYCLLDPFTGAAHAVFEAARNAVCTGARPLAVTDCLNFGSPEKPDVMWQFSRSVDGITAACQKLGIPVVSGNVSFYNETKSASIYPTPVIGLVGMIDDMVATPPIKQYFQSEGDIIILLGKNLPEIGGSEYLKVVHSQVRGRPPVIDFDLEKGVQDACVAAFEAGILKSAHDCAEGGLAVALAECCISSEEGVCGAMVLLDDEGMRPDVLLFGESQSRIIVSVGPKDQERMMQIAHDFSVPVTVIGKTGSSNLQIDIVKNSKQERIINKDVSLLKDIWKTSLEKSLES